MAEEVFEIVVSMKEGAVGGPYNFHLDDQVVTIGVAPGDSIPARAAKRVILDRCNRAGRWERVGQFRTITLKLSVGLVADIKRLGEPINTGATVGASR